MRRAKTEIQCGFLVMIFLVSGISALRCYSSTSVLYNITDHTANFAVSDNITTCKNACMEAQVMLRIDQMVLLVIDRGCADKELDGAGSNSSGDPHFTVKSNVRYCFTDLCNQEMSKQAPWSAGNDTVPEESSSTQCYSGLTFDPKSSLEKVTCRKNYSQCYHSHGTIQTGHISMSLLINTCQRLSCIAPKNQSFGPIEFSQWGSCCNGSYCNRNTMSIPGYYGGVSFRVVSSLPKLDTEHGRERMPSVPGIDADPFGSPFNRIPPKEESVSEIDRYDDLKPSEWGLPIQAEAVRFQSCLFCNLLIALGIVVFGPQ